LPVGKGTVLFAYNAPSALRQPMAIGTGRVNANRALFSAKAAFTTLVGLPE
jgi:hypothetical protein